jgi:ornithine--oxo-acid transaminase
MMATNNSAEGPTSHGGDSYHAKSSSYAISAEAEYAAHNYHPLPVVFARAQGASVWDPVSTWDLNQ